jgi:hypothetical protein
MNSDSEINYLGDYSSCKMKPVFNYYIILNVDNGVYNFSLGTSLCYFKECDIDYMNKAKLTLMNFSIELTD